MSERNPKWDSEDYCKKKWEEEWNLFCQTHAFFNVQICLNVMEMHMK